MRHGYILALGLAISSTPAAAQDATIKIFDASVNKFLNSVQPITRRGTFSLAPFCESTYTITLLLPRFATTAVNIQITGLVTLTVCSLTITAPLNTTADVRYDATQRAIVATINPTTVQARVNILWFEVPFTISLPPTLSIPPIPLGIGQLSFQAVHGPVKLRLEPQNPLLLKRNGYLELQTDLAVW